MSTAQELVVRLSIESKDVLKSLDAVEKKLLALNNQTDIEIDADAKKALKKIDSIKSKIEDTKNAAMLSVGLETSDAEKSAKELQKRLKDIGATEIEVAFDTKATKTALTNLIKDFNKIKGAVGLKDSDLKAVDKALEKLTKIRKSLDDVKSAASKAKVEVDTKAVEAAAKQSEELASKSEQAAKELEGLEQQAKDTQKAVADLNSDIAKGSSELASLREEADRTQKSINDFAEQSKVAKVELEGFQKQSSEVSNELSNLKNEVSVSEDKLRGLDGQISEATDSLKGMQDKLILNQGSLDDYAAKVEIAENKLKELRETTKAEEDALEGLYDKIAKNEATLRDLGNQISASQQKFDGLTSKVEEAQKEFDSYTSQISEAKNKLQGFEVSAEAARNNVEALTVQISDQQNKLDGLNASVTETKQKLAQLKSETDELTASISKQKTELAESKSEYASYQVTLKGAKRELKDLTKEKEAAQRSTDKLEKTSKKSKQTEADLADQTAKAREALDKKNQELEEAEIKLAQVAASAAEAEARFAKLDQEVTNTKDRVKAFKAEQKDLQDAIKESNSDIEETVRSLNEYTKEAETAKRSAAGYKGAVTKASKELEILEAKLEGARVELGNLNNLTSEASSELVSLRRAASEAEVATAGFEDQLRGAQEQLALLNQQADATRTEIETLNATFTESEAKLAGLRSEIEKTEQSLNTLQGEFAENEAKLDGLKASVASAESQLNALNLEIAEAGNRLGTLRAEISQAQGDLAGLETQIKTAAANFDDLQARTQEAAKEFERVSDSVQETSKRFEESSASTQEAGQSLAEIEAKITQAKESYEALNKELDDTKKKTEDSAQEFTDSAEKLAALNAEIKKTKQQKNGFNLALSKSKTKLEESQNALKTAREELQNFQSESEKTAGSLSGLNSEYADQEARLNTLTKTLQEAEARNNELAESFSRQQSELAETTRQFNETKAATDEQRNSQDALTREIEEQTRALDDKKRAYADQLNLIEQNQRALDDQKKAIDGGNSSSEEQQRQLDDLVRKIEENNQALAENVARLEEKQQAEREAAANSEKLTQEATELQRRNDDLNRSFEETQQALSRLSDEFQQKQEALSKASQELGEFGTKSQQSSEELQGLVGNVNEATTSLNSLNSEIEQNRASLDDLVSKNKEAADKYDELSEAIKKSQAQKGGYNSALTKIKKKLEEQRAALASVKAETLAAADAMSDQQTQVTQASASYQDLARQASEAANQLAATQTEIDTVNQSLADQQTRLAAVRQEYDDQQRALNESREALEANSAAMAESEQRLTGLRSAENDAAQGINNTQEALESKNREIEETIRNLEELKNQEASLKGNLSALESQTQSSTQQIEGLNNNISELSQQFQDLQTRNQQANEALQDTARRTEEANQALSETQARTEDASRSYAEMAANVDRAEQELSNVQQQVAETNDALSQNQNELKTAAEAVEDYNRRAAALEGQNEALTDSIEDSKKALEILNKELQSKKSELGINKAFENLKATIQQVKQMGDLNLVLTIDNTQALDAVQEILEKVLKLDKAMREMGKGMDNGMDFDKTFSDGQAAGFAPNSKQRRNPEYTAIGNTSDLGKTTEGFKNIARAAEEFVRHVSKSTNQMKINANLIMPQVAAERGARGVNWSTTDEQGRDIQDVSMRDDIALRLGKQKGKVLKGDLETLLHEIRHSMQKEAEKYGNKDFKMLTAADAKGAEQKGLVKKATTQYGADKHATEIDAMLFGAQNVEQFAEMLGLELVEGAEAADLVAKSLFDLQRASLAAAKNLRDNPISLNDFFDLTASLEGSTLATKNESLTGSNVLKPIDTDDQTELDNFQRQRVALQQQTLASYAGLTKTVSKVASAMDFELPDAPDDPWLEGFGTEVNEAAQEMESLSIVLVSFEEVVKRLEIKAREAAAELASVKAIKSEKTAQNRNDYYDKVIRSDRSAMAAADVVAEAEDKDESAQARLAEKALAAQAKEALKAEAKESARIARETAKIEQMISREERAEDVRVAKAAAKIKTDAAKEAARLEAKAAKDNAEAKEKNQKAIKAGQIQRGTSRSLIENVSQTVFPNISETIEVVTELHKGFMDLADALGDDVTGMKDFAGAFNKLKNPVFFVLAAAGLGLVAKAAIPVLESFSQLEKSLQTVKGIEFAEAMETIKSVALDTGASLDTAAKNFSKFALSAKGSSFEAAAADIFESVSKYAGAIGATDDELGRGFNALQQIAAKGKVSLEELNGQLAEALPGATNLAAEALGLTKGELIELVAAGDLMADELLPKLSNKLNQVSGAISAVTPKTLTQELNILKNKGLLDLADAFKPFYEGLRAIMSAMNGMDASPILGGLNAFSVVLALLTGALVKYGLALAGSGIKMAMNSQLLRENAKAMVKNIGISLAYAAAVSAIYVAIQNGANGKDLTLFDKDELDKNLKQLQELNKELELLRDNQKPQLRATEGADSALSGFNQGQVQSSMEDFDNMSLFQKAGTSAGNFFASAFNKQYRDALFADGRLFALPENQASGFALRNQVENKKATQETITETQKLISEYMNLKTVMIDGKNVEVEKVAAMKAGNDELTEGLGKAKEAFSRIAEEAKSPAESVALMKAEWDSILAIYPQLADVPMDFSNTQSSLASLTQGLNEAQKQGVGLNEAFQTLDPTKIDAAVESIKTRMSYEEKSSQTYKVMERDLRALLKIQDNLTELTKEQAIEVSKLGDAFAKYKRDAESTKQDTTLASKLTEAMLLQDALITGETKLSSVEYQKKQIQSATHQQRMKDLQDEAAQLLELAKLATPKEILALKKITGNKNLGTDTLNADALTNDDMVELEKAIKADKLPESLKNFVKELTNERNRINSEYTDTFIQQSELMLGVREEFSQADAEIAQNAQDLSANYKSAFEGFDKTFQQAENNLKGIIKNLNGALQDAEDAILKAKREQESLKTNETFRKAKRGASDLTQQFLQLLEEDYNTQQDVLNSDMDLSKNAREVQNQFEDGIAGINAAFDDYLNSFKDFQKQLADLNKQKAEQEKVRRENEANKAAASGSNLKVDYSAMAANEQGQTRAVAEAFREGILNTGYKQGVSNADQNKALGLQVRATNLAEKEARQAEISNESLQSIDSGISGLPVTLSQMMQTIPAAEVPTELLGVNIQMRDLLTVIANSCVSGNFMSDQAGNKQGVINAASQRLNANGTELDAWVKIQEKAMEDYKTGDKSKAVADFSQSQSAIERIEKAIDKDRQTLSKAGISEYDTMFETKNRDQIDANTVVLTTKYGTMTSGRGNAAEANAENQAAKKSDTRYKRENGIMQTIGNHESYNGTKFVATPEGGYATEADAIKKGLIDPIKAAGAETPQGKALKGEVNTAIGLQKELNEKATEELTIQKETNKLKSTISTDVKNDGVSDAIKAVRDDAKNELESLREQFTTEAKTTGFAESDDTINEANRTLKTLEAKSKEIEAKMSKSSLEDLNAKKAAATASGDTAAIAMYSEDIATYAAALDEYALVQDEIQTQKNKQQGRINEETTIGNAFKSMEAGINYDPSKAREAEGKLGAKYLNMDDRNEYELQAKVQEIKSTQLERVNEEFKRLKEQGVDLDIAMQQARDTIQEIDNIELNNFKENMDTVTNQMKDQLGNGLEAIFSLDFSDDSTSISQKLFGIVDNIAKDIQKYAASQLKGFIMDAIFNTDEDEGNKNQKSAQEVAQTAIQAASDTSTQQTAAYAATTTEATNEANNVDDANTEARATNVKKNHDKMMGIIGGAAGLVGGIASGNTGAILGGIGMIAGTLLGGSGGGMLGSTIGSMIGGMFADGGTIKDAMAMERAQSGGKKPVLAVLHAGEEVISTKGGEADQYRAFKNSGLWDAVRQNSFAYGGTVGSSGNRALTNWTNSRNNTDNSSKVTNNNIIMQVKHSDLVPKTQQVLKNKERNLFS